MSLECIPNLSLILILRFVGRPADFLRILMVCHSWRNRFDAADAELWFALSVDYGITIHSQSIKRTLRCTTDHRKVFFRAYFKKQREMHDRHEQLVVSAKKLLQGNRDSPRKLEKLIKEAIPDSRYLNPDYRCGTMEDNTLLTLACRNSQLKCIRLLVERYNADTNVPDMGGFTPLILCAYHGNFAGVLFLLGQGADRRAVGRLRSGPRLTAEHWAAVMGNMEIFRYLHALRRRFGSNSVIPSGRSLAPSQEAIAHVAKGEANTKLNFSEFSEASLASASEFSVTVSSTISHSAINILNPGLLDIAGDLSDLFGEDTQVSFATDTTVPGGSGAAAGTDCTDVSTAHSASNPASANSSTALGPQAPVGASAAATQAVVPEDTHAEEEARQRFCYCRQGFEGQMIACDSPRCPTEWFHYQCVGLHARPSGKWFCPGCTSAASESGQVSSEASEAQAEEYCICGHGFLGSMVGCDNSACLVEWYHFECVHLTEEPAGHWKCPSCAGRPFAQPVSLPCRTEGSRGGGKRGRRRQEKPGLCPGSPVRRAVVLTGEGPGQSPTPSSKRRRRISV